MNVSIDYCGEVIEVPQAESVSRLDAERCLVWMRPKG